MSIVAKELACSIAIGAAVAVFAPAPMGAAVLINAVKIQFAVSLVFHTLSALFQKTAPVCDWCAGVNFAYFTGFNARLLLHETGHFLAALLLYKNSRPCIQIIPFVGGITIRHKVPLSLFGRKIGTAATGILWAASGSACTLLISAGLLTAAIAIRDKYPQLSKYLTCWGALDFLNHTRYAFSALRADPTNRLHDYVQLSNLGLHPAVAAVAILAIPIVIVVGMHWKETQRR